MRLEEKSWAQINAEIEVLHLHQRITERGIFLLAGLALLVGLFHWPQVFAWLFFIVTMGYLGGLHAADKGDFRGYWLSALGSQAVAAIMIGVPLAIRYGL